jgi:hypothetical protein
VLLPGTGDRGDELDVDLDGVAGKRLLVSLPAFLVPLVRCELGSRLISRRLRIRQIPEGLTTISWYRFKYIAIRWGPKW